MTCLLMVVVSGSISGCSRGGKIELGDTNSDTFKDGQYYQSLMSLNVGPSFQGFLERCSPADRVKYINKSTEDGPMHTFPLKTAYEHFVNDTNAEVAAAAKEALSKVPTREEYDKLRKEELDKAGGK
jgi:hypothetical protein